ncbi:MAG TPA: MerR family transcriptional regulator [Streptosporangiaceae bacterium]|nr:MerR family transcriptional regulator [Streptosporangiaceae bacterium]
MSAEPARAYLGIGEVLAQLQAEFPDVSVSKIRFLENAGLIQPARSPSKYRKFSPGDVERLRYILTAQRDQYLPLRVIKDQLDAGGQDHPERPAGRYPGPAPLTRRELLEATGLDEARLAELEDFGLVRRSGGRYGPEALAAARAIVALDGYGVQARHLRVLRASAERETALIEQVVAPILRQRSDGARDRAARSAREIAAVTLQLHAALIEATLADAGFGEPRPGQTDG